MRALLVLLAIVAAAPLRAHPHVFIDAGADFLFRDGRLAALRVTWTYDAFATLYYLQEMGVDPDGDGVLTEAERAVLVTDHTSWVEGFEGDSYLWVGEDPAPLTGPLGGDASMRDGQLTITFTRDLVAPVPAAGLRATAKLYDPTYFIAYTAAVPPLAEGIGQACRTRVIPFDPSTQVQALQRTLMELSREETPEDTTVGALFADTIELSCD